MKTTSKFLEFAQSLLFALVLVLILRTFVFQSVRVQQTSMVPTLRPKDLLLTNRTIVFTKGYKRGQVLYFKDKSSKNLLVKRLIGLPGDTVTIEDGRIYVNGKLQEEPYLPKDAYTHPSDQKTWTLEDKNYFFLGDNRTPGGSLDSRAFGPIPEQTIRGQVLFRIYPFKDAGFISQGEKRT